MIFDKSVPQRVPNTPVAEVGYTSPVCVYLLTVLSMEWEAFMQVYWNPSLLRQVWYQHALVCCLMCKLPRYQRSRKELIFSRNFVCRFILVEFICCLILLKNIEIWRSTVVSYRLENLNLCTELIYIYVYGRMLSFYSSITWMCYLRVFIFESIFSSSATCVLAR